MLDIAKIQNDFEEVEKALAKRMPAEKVSKLLNQSLKIDQDRRKLIQKTEQLKAERNQASKTKPDQKTISQMKQVGEEIKKIDQELEKIEKRFQAVMEELPNLPAEDVPAGDKENNQILEVFGKKPEFDFKPKNHLEISENLKLIDYQRAAKMSGTGFWCYTGKGALLEWALLNYFLDFHQKNNYIFILPPFLLTEESAYTSGHLPKFRDDLFWTEKGKLCLNPTSEMMLGNYHRDEIIAAEELPLKYCAYSACFRREAGSYRQEERGMLRGHQFNKIEMFQLTKPEDSWDAFKELTQNAQKLVAGLGLHYQTVKLAAEDASASMAKTIDIEVYLPSIQGYKEVSSVSNALDYQARRGNIRYQDSQTKKNAFVHTLNASGLATTRLFPAILEQFQQPDGSVAIPEALQKYCRFEKI